MNDKLGEVLADESKNDREMLTKINEVFINSPQLEFLQNFKKCMDKQQKLSEQQSSSKKQLEKELEQMKYRVGKQEFQLNAFEQQLELMTQQNEQLQNTLFSQQDRIINYKVKEKRVIVLLKSLLSLGIDVEEISNSLFNPDGTIKANEVQIDDDNLVLMKEKQDLEMCYKLLKHKPKDKTLIKKVAFERTDIRAEDNIIEYSSGEQAADNSIISESKELSFNFIGRDNSETGRSSLMATNYQNKCQMQQNGQEKLIPDMKSKLQLNLVDILNKKQLKKQKKMQKKQNQQEQPLQSG